MSVFTPISIVVLAMLIMASLQLTPGVLILFYHYALGRFSKAKASRLVLFFVLGAETISACLFLFSFYIAYIFFFQHSPISNVLTYVATGILFSLSFASFFFYFRRGSGTKLFIPRDFARALDHNARTVSTASDAFALGVFSNTCELIFTLPLYLITSVELMQLDVDLFLSHLLTLLYIVVPVIPLLITRWRFQSGHNLVDLQKSRTKNKPFTRLILSFSYLTIAIIILCFRINF